MASLVIVDKLSKRYRIGKGITSLREIFAPDKASSLNKYHWAIKDVSFELQPGEALGIIGPNGAGKTTILKILSQVTKPTSGNLHVLGKLSALIELGAGFHPDLTGRENIYLNGTILGMRRSEIKSRFDEIVNFAGIGEYLDTPVKRYSSGMYARLGFSIAAHVDPQILLVDEVLAVGDLAFQQKCYARMSELRANGVALIFVSHNMEVVRRVCNRGMVMYRGQNIFIGTSGEAVLAYSNAIRQAAKQSDISIPLECGLSERVMTFDAEVEGVRILDSHRNEITVIKSMEKVSVAVDIHFHKDVHQPIFSCTIRTPDGSLVFDTTTQWMNIKTPDFSAGDYCRTEFHMILPLLEGEYQLGVDVTSSDLKNYYDRLERALSFWVTSSGEANGLVNLKANVTISKLIPNQIRT